MTARKDLTGLRAGSLTVRQVADNVSKTSRNPSGHTAWLCDCDCGRRVVVATNHLSRQRSCGTCVSPFPLGVNRKFDLQGQVFGRLTVIAEADPTRRSNGKKQTMWTCRCDCGEMIEVRANHLTSESSRSCGCERGGSGNRKTYLWKMYKLTEEEFAQLLSRQGGRCATCDSEVGSASRGDLYVDHDHRCCPGPRSCGACVRGLLCQECNFVEGKFAKLDPERAFRLQVYSLEGVDVLGSLTRR